ncbi:glycoside hydrolase family 140 protein [Sphingomonas sp. MG17]|uniref:Glycoside hydrolase family 140 protein n=1 Tax=Sphingomonas tagetis TaxID=2949092 RepID=A0A9X2KK72_9SPHN|nr:glycoside hydrolase family 140 protein [Sphingomonas tagetis]MCP3729490.1 glycoside hydrolase family 140 protein [Sphingomonas tagetis]
MNARKLMLAVTLALTPVAASAQTPPLTVSANHRYLEAGGKPFFWMGDTAWLLLSRLNREETDFYLATRQRQGFNVIQVMVLHTNKMTNRYDAPALVEGDPGRPRTTPGNDPAKAGEYDYWDHLDWVVERAAAHGIYVAMVPAWGDLAMERQLNEKNVATYARFMAERYGKAPNIVWLNGGDTRSEMRSAVWDALGTTIKKIAPRQLMTFHPIGRTASSWQWHEAPWLDFNMFQSGHRSYAQEGPNAIAEDNWRYVAQDLARTPPKPTIDGEPSYENIPHGLHEQNQPRWQAADVRRYGWWAVMAGAFGHSYGENHIMQFFAAGSKDANFEPNLHWRPAIEAPGATQMRHLRTLIESRPMLERVPDQSLIRDNGTRYDRVAASRGKSYAFAYSYTGAPFTMKLGAIAGRQVKASWYSPRDGAFTPIATFANRGERRFDPPGETKAGNDWVLVLDGTDK